MPQSSSTTTTVKGSKHNNHNSTNQQQQQHYNDDDDDAPVSAVATIVIVALYVLSGCSQPLLMTLLRRVGVADPTCQLYMLFYYFGPAAAIFTISRNVPTSSSGGGSSNHTTTTTTDRNDGRNKNKKITTNRSSSSSSWPSLKTIAKGSGIALFDIIAQTMNYTGASLAGPTIFAIVYSSVTIWAALYSQIFLGRTMDSRQWIGVIGVFGGLASTATDSLNLGSSVLHGLVLVIIGSSMHGLFYVMSEAVMTVGSSRSERLTVQQNCAVQGITASFSFLLWQLFYTVPRFDDKIWQPMEHAGTSIILGLALLVIFAIVSFIHSMTFYHTLRHLPGGSTSAGVFKGLQAVLVFVLTHFVYCGRVGGEEMCFTRAKFISLVSVSGGVIWYGFATRRREKNGPKATLVGYERIHDGGEEGIEIEEII